MPPDTHFEPVIRPVAACTSAEVANALTTSFERYFVPMNIGAEAYERRFRAEHLDPHASRVWFHGGRPAAIVLVARRGWTSRIAAMGVALELRGKGLGRRLMDEAIADARARGDRAMLLEVIEQNAPARALYASLGFEPVRRLVGYRRAAAEARAIETRPEELTVCDPSEVARAAVQEGCAGLPWGLAPETLAGAALPARAWSLGDEAFAMIPDPGAPVLTLAALVVRRAARRKGLGTRLMNALAAQFPERSWSVPAIVPESVAPGFFEALGWEQQPLTQLELRLDLAKPR